MGNLVKWKGVKTFKVSYIELVEMYLYRTSVIKETMFRQAQHDQVDGLNMTKSTEPIEILLK